MRIAVTGSHGLIGSALVDALIARGDDVARVQRSEEALFDVDEMKGADVVVHLAGENIGAHRWSNSQRERIIMSRQSGTSFVASAIAQMKNPPKTFVSASAIGIYGNRGDEELTEKSGAGTGFLASVCTSWESATQPARDAQIRTVLLRTGIVLSAKGGALAKQLPLFRHGIGGVLGNGSQYMSWISIDDEVRAILHLIDNRTIDRPVNLTTPSPVTNREFTLTLARVMGKRAFMRVPGIALKIALGRGIANELLLAGQRALPAILLDSGFTFMYGDLETALKECAKTVGA